MKKRLTEVLGDSGEIIVFDTETTGLDPSRETIIEFSGYKIAYKVENGRYKQEILEEIDQYINPGRPLPPTIVTITGITDEILKNAPCESDAFEKIRSFIGESPLLTGYNVKFDIKMLTALYDRQYTPLIYREAYDVMAAAKEYVTPKELKDATGTDSYKQCNVATVMGMSEGVQFHLANEDSKITARLLFTFAEYELNEDTKKQAVIKNMYYNKGHSSIQEGLIINTDICKCMYSYRYGRFCPVKIADQELFDTIDVIKLESDVLTKMGLSDAKDIRKYKGDKFAFTGSEKPVKCRKPILWIKYGFKRIYLEACGEDGIWSKSFYDLKTSKWSSPRFMPEDLEKIACLAASKSSFEELVASMQT